MRQGSDPADAPRPPALRAIPPGLHFVSTPIGAARDMPVVQTIYKWLRKHADFRQDYGRAREIQAEEKNASPRTTR